MKSRGSTPPTREGCLLSRGRTDAAPGPARREVEQGKEPVGAVVDPLNDHGFGSPRHIGLHERRRLAHDCDPVPFASSDSRSARQDAARPTRVVEQVHSCERRGAWTSSSRAARRRPSSRRCGSGSRLGPADAALELCEACSDLGAALEASTVAVALDRAEHPQRLRLAGRVVVGPQEPEARSR